MLLGGHATLLACDVAHAQLSPLPMFQPAPVDTAVATLPHVMAGWIGTAKARTYVLEAGPTDSAEPPLVLVHGLGERGVADFYPVLGELAQTRRVIAIDLPGLGRSELGRDAPTPETFVTRVIEVVSTRAPNGFDLLGHSLGGVVALMFAADHPELVRRLVLVDAAGVLHREAFIGTGLRNALDPLHRIAPRAGQLIEGAGKAVLSALRAYEPNDRLLWLGARTLSGPQVQAALSLIQVDVGPYCEKLTVPTLLLWGERDTIAPLRSARVLRARIAAATLVTLADVGHVPMSNAPTLFVQEVQTFLARTGASPNVSPSSVSVAPNEPRDHVCEGQTDLVITGRYRTLTLNHCHRVILRNVHANRVVSEHSDGSIEDGTITSGMVASHSDWLLTGGVVMGDVALSVANSRIDLAGTRLHGTRAAAEATAPSRLLLSAVDTQSPLGSGSRHGHVQLVKDARF